MTNRFVRRLAAFAALLILATTLAPSVATAQTERPGNTAYAAIDLTPELQIDRLYLAIFNRNPDPGGKAYWVGQLKGGVRLSRIADLMVGASPEFEAKYGKLNDSQFINQLYLNVQGRNADSGGLNFWLGELNSRRRTRGGVVLGFSESEEFRLAQSTTLPVDRLYCAFFLRNPDAGGKKFWSSKYLFDGDSLGSIAQQFTASPEFVSRYGSLTNRQFVELIYKNVLGRSLPLTEVGGPAFWTSELGRGVRSRGQVMAGFSESTEYKARFTAGGNCPPAGKATPTAVNDRGTVVNKGTVVVNWSQNDTLPSGTTVEITSTPGKGNAKNNNNGTFSYTHTSGATGATTDSFTYKLTSSDNVTATATVTIAILAVGDDGIPTAVDDVVSTDFQKAVVIPWAVNDTTDGTVSVQSTTTPANGTVTNNGDNTFTYTPKAGFAGVDTFNYTLKQDTSSDTSTASVTVTVRASTGTDDGITPTAVMDRVITKPNTTTIINWASNDSLIDGAFLADFTQPKNGTITDLGNGTFRYVPVLDYTASRTGQGLVPDSFSYTLGDNDSGTSTAVVDVIVLAKPACEVFMNFPYSPEIGAPDVNNLELFFSDKGCFELYDKNAAKDVVWSPVTVDGAAVATSSPSSNVLRDLAPVTPANRADNSVTVAGTATLKVNGANAVVIQFQLTFLSTNGTTWARDTSTYRGRGDADVTILINPLA